MHDSLHRSGEPTCRSLALDNDVCYLLSHSLDSIDDLCNSMSDLHNSMADLHDSIGHSRRSRRHSQYSLTDLRDSMNDEYDL